MTPRLPRLGLKACTALALWAAVSSWGLAGKKKEAEPQRPQLRATVQPSYTIAAGPLGFSAPGEFYLGARNSLVSLDFLDEDHLLFTFRVPGLIHRLGNRAETEGERKIRALVLKLPEGTVDAEAVWTLHDRARYLYNLGKGQFLLRDKDTISIGDAALQLKPLMHFPGPVLWMEVDPSGKYLVTGSEEPAKKQAKAGDGPETDDETDTVLRILRREDGKIMLVSHVRSSVHVPINGEGYIELLRGRGNAWALSLDRFDGGETPVGQLDSACSPMVNFLSEKQFLVTGCTSSGDPTLQSMGMNGKRLWDLNLGNAILWPVLVTNADGTRLARETLLSSRSVNAMAPIEADDIKGQDVMVLDAATGKMVLRAAASPVFDAGGNVAISPSGRRVVIVMDANLQVFELPAPAPLADTGLDKAGR